MTLEELRARMTAREFRLWQALYAADPWGPERTDLMLGRVAAVIANCLTKGSFTEDDFVLKFNPGRPARAAHAERTDEELKELVMRANANMGGDFVMRQSDGGDDQQTRGGPVG